MADYGTSKTDKAIAKIEKNLVEVYGQAEKDIQQKLDTFMEKYYAKEAILKEKVKTGEISPVEFNNWKQGQIFQKKQWKIKKHDISQVLTNANKVAVGMINGESINVFASNANYMSYQVEHTAGIFMKFQLYDSTTVENLIKNDPQVLPKWKVNEPKDYVWNGKKLDRQITQGIIQGENLDQISKRVATALSSQNMNHMKTFTATAMTAAQNSGRNESLKRYKELGIDVVKRWMATLDGRTRDSHRMMDGETQKVGDKWHPFKFSNGLRFPGDPEGPAHEVYNCRCTLVGDLKDYPSEYDRYDNIDGKPVGNMTYQQWYAEKEKQAKIAKLGPLADDLKVQVNDLKSKVSSLESEVAQKGADKVFKDIWADDVTYADWEDKKDSIQTKRDWFEQKIKQREEERKDYYLNEFFNVKYDGDLALAFYPGLNKYDDITDYVFGNEWQQLANKLTYDERDKALKLAQRYYNNEDFYGKNIAKMKGFLDDLDEFEKHGAEYSKLLKNLEQAKYDLAQKQLHLKAVQKELPKTFSTSFDADAYSQTRKDAALWAKNPRQADNALRDVCGEVWRNATGEERDAIFEYTASYHKFNEPLRGIEYGTSRYLGVGNTDLDAGSTHNGKNLNAMTSIIDKSSYDHDMWFNRGCHFDGMDKFFQCDMNLLRDGTQEQLEAELLGKSVTEYGFMSMGSSKGKGFSGDIILNIYTPSGTKMMYVEPFSAFGKGAGYYWDGISTQSSLGGELETILQQGTEFRITKISREDTWSTIYFDLEVIGQNDVQLWQP